MKIEQLTPGQVVYNVMSRQMGNTTLKSADVFSIKVMEVHPELGYVVASWNGNPGRRYNRRDVSKWKKDKPITISSGFGTKTRLATREEIKMMKAKEAARVAGQTEGYFNLIVEPITREECLRRMDEEGM